MDNRSRFAGRLEELARMTRRALTDAERERVATELERIAATS